MNSTHPLYKKLETLEGRGLKILDIGGWFAPCRIATHMVDVMPYETMNVEGAYGPGELNLKRENYHQMDLSRGDPLPFPDQYFNFVVCRHTLEDISNPVFVCSEIKRVAKEGYLETPHRVYESTRGVERHWWAGHYHHRWFVEMEKDSVVFQFKPHCLHENPKFVWWCPPWRKVREEFKNTGIFWQGSFKAEEKVIIDYRDVKADLARFKKAYRSEKIFRFKWMEN